MGTSYVHRFARDQYERDALQYRVGTQAIDEPPHGVPRLARIHQHDTGTKTVTQSLQRVVGRARIDHATTVESEDQRQTLPDLVVGIDEEDFMEGMRCHRSQPATR